MPIFFFPQLCRLFAGGSICRYYKVNELDLCRFDNTYIETILTIWQLNDVNFLYLQNFVDAFLNNVFLRYHSLSEIVYEELKKARTIDKKGMDTIIKKWKEIKFGK